MAPVISGRNLYNNLFNTKFMKKWLPDNPTKAAATLALVSTVTKDALNCYYYTTQSYHNKKIPEDKRTFVASIDLSNGLVNVIVPILSKPLIEKASDHIFNKRYAKYFNKSSAEALYNKLKAKNIDCDLKSVENILGKTSSKWARAGFAVIATLIASQIICKRVITPSVATPLADVIKAQFEKYEMKKAGKLAPTENAESKSSKSNDVKSTNSANESARFDFYTDAYKPPKFMRNV